MEDSQTTSVISRDINKHITDLQREFEECKHLLQNESENKRQDIKETIKFKEKQLADLQNKVHSMSDVARRSERIKVPTEMMLEYQREEASKKERRLVNLYKQWKAQARKTRERLMSGVIETQLSSLADDLEKGRDDVMRFYTELRSYVAPSADLWRKIDACEAVTHDIMKIIFERLTGIDGDFDAEHERGHLRELLDREYALSIYGSTAANSSISHHSSSSYRASKRVDAAAELAAREAEYKTAQEERKQKERIKALEEQHKKEIEIQRTELEHLQAEKDVKARLEAYDREIKQMDDAQPIKREQVRPNYTPQPPAPSLFNSSMLSEPPCVNQLAKAVQDIIMMNRLPTPEPVVFIGEPIHFIEWKSTFMSLIDRKGISAADKLYYLKRYVSGPARKCLEGTFYRNDEEAYQDAWERLNL